jgi:hypothetical protein
MQQLRGVILLVNQDHKIVTASPGAIGLERAIGFGEAGTQMTFHLKAVHEESFRLACMFCERCLASCQETAETEELRLRYHHVIFLSCL